MSATAAAAHHGPVVEVPAEAVHPLRRRVLRDGDPTAEVDWVEDHRPRAVHLAVLDDDGAALAVCTVFPDPWPQAPGADAWRLRGMAVAPELQGTGVGAVLLDAAVGRARAAGAAVLWAHGRDSALGFYRRRGWRVVGEGYWADPGLPHHDVAIDLAPGASPS